MFSCRFSNFLTVLVLAFSSIITGCGSLGQDDAVVAHSSASALQGPESQFMTSDEVRFHDQQHDHEHVDDINITNVESSTEAFSPERGETISFSYDLTHADRYSTLNQNWVQGLYIFDADFNPEETDAPFDEEGAKLYLDFTSYLGNHQRHTFEYDGTSGDWIVVAGVTVISTNDPDKKLPPGRYIAALTAYCSTRIPQEPGINRYYADVEYIPFVIELAPKTDLIEFPTALPFNDDEGNQVDHPTVYFKAETEGVEGSAVHHPVVLSLDRAIDGGEEQVQGQQRNPTIDEVAAFPFAASWKFDTPPTKEITYEWRLRDPDGEELTEVETVTVRPGTLLQPLTAMLRLAPVVQQIEFLKLDYRIAGEEEWQTEALSLDQPIFVTLNDYRFTGPPFSLSKPPTEGIFDIATHLANGASNPVEVRSLLTQKMVSEFWQDKEFHFDPERSFTILTPEDHWLAKTVRFNYAEFMQAYNDPGTVWEGDSMAMSCLMATFCQALGTDALLRRYTGKVIEPTTNPLGYVEYLMGDRDEFYGPLETLEIKSAAFKDESDQTPIYKVYNLDVHQVVSSLDQGETVWDVSFMVGSGVLVDDLDEMTYRLQYLLANTFDFTAHDPIPLTEIDQ